MSCVVCRVSRLGSYVIPSMVTPPLCRVVVMNGGLENKESVCDRVGEEEGLEDGFETETGQDCKGDEDVWSSLGGLRDVGSDDGEADDV